jgi:hypothetical protein
MKKFEEKEKEKQRQIQLIHKLATRLPWMVLGIFLLAFLIIFTQVYFSRG